MKILIDARSLGERPSGIGKYVYTMSLHMYKNSDITLITDINFSSEMKHLAELGIEILEYGSKIKKGLGLFAYYTFVQKCIHEVRPDIFWEANNLVPIKIKNPYGKLAVTIHDMFPITTPSYYPWAFRWYFKYGISRSVKNFDLIIYNSEETRRECETLFYFSKSKRNHIGYTIVAKPPILPISDNYSFLYIGNIEKRKGVDILLDAFIVYREYGGEKKLRLGGFIREKDLEEKITYLSKIYPDSFVYLGYVSDEDKYREYASCTRFIFPSMAEGFGVPVIEAMCYGKSVIASNLSIFREIVGDSITYADMRGDVKRKIDSLVDAMCANDYNIDKSAYTKVIDRYTTSVLADGILTFFREAIEEKHEKEV